MIIAYIAHPISGNVIENVGRIHAIIRHINLTEPDTVPFAPYLGDVMALDDNIPEERARGIRNDTELIRRTRIDELRLYGPCISKGMLAEAQLAAAMGIAIKNYTPDTLRL